MDGFERQVSGDGKVLLVRAREEDVWREVQAVAAVGGGGEFWWVTPFAVVKVVVPEMPPVSGTPEHHPV